MIIVKKMSYVQFLTFDAVVKKQLLETHHTIFLDKKKKKYQILSPSEEKISLSEENFENLK